MSKKLVSITILISILVGLKLNSIYVPENFERPWLFKFGYSLLAVAGKMVIKSLFSDKLNKSHFYPTTI
jgi:hypothetical protein